MESSPTDIHSKGIWPRSRFLARVPDEQTKQEEHGMAKVLCKAKPETTPTSVTRDWIRTADVSAASATETEPNIEQWP